jgi:hypothetical protein
MPTINQAPPVFSKPPLSHIVGISTQHDSIKILNLKHSVTIQLSEPERRGQIYFFSRPSLRTSTATAAALRPISAATASPLLRSVALKRFAKIPKGAPTYSMVLKQGVLGGLLGDFAT